MADKIEHISANDVLNDGREKINKFAIDPAMRAEIIANQSIKMSIDANNTAQNTDNRLDNIVSSEMQDAEIIDARKPQNQNAFESLGKRLDNNDLRAKKNEILASNLMSLKYKTTAIIAKPTGNTASSHDFIVNGASDLNAQRLSKIASDAVLVVLVNITDDTSVNYVPTPEDVVMLNINNAKKNNLKIKMLKPHIVLNWSDAFHRYTYAPSDYTQAFENWGNILMRYAEICTDNDIDILCVGVEQALMTLDIYTPMWKMIVTRIKTRFPNLKLTYAAVSMEWAHENEFRGIFELVDYIGCNFYPILSDKSTDQIATITKNDLLRGLDWEPVYNMSPLERIKDLSNTYNKQIYITECGAMARIDALYRPISQYQDTTDSTKIDFRGQAMYLDTIISATSALNCVIGFCVWSTGFPFNFYENYDSEIFGESYSATEEILQKLYGKEIYDA